MEKLTLEEVKKQSKEILGKNLIIELDYITQEMVDADNAQTAKDAGENVDIATIWGNNARTGGMVINGQNYNVYYFEGVQPFSNNVACNTDRTWYLRMDQWVHSYAGKCNSGREAWYFNPR